MSVVMSVPITAGSGAANVHVSPWNMFVTAQSERVLRLRQRKGVRSLFNMEIINFRFNKHYLYSGYIAMMNIVKKSLNLLSVGFEIMTAMVIKFP
jgi:hypothetical protein